MGTPSADVLEHAAEIRRFFPPAFDALAVCMRHGVKSLVLRHGPSLLWGSYDPERAEITIHVDVDWAHVAEELTQRHGTPVLPAESAVWVFFHELGHHTRRARLQRMAARGVLRSEDAVASWSEESAADRFAWRHFTEWKRGVQNGQGW